MLAALRRELPERTAPRPAGWTARPTVTCATRAPRDVTSCSKPRPIRLPNNVGTFLPPDLKALKVNHDPLCQGRTQRRGRLEAALGAACPTNAKSGRSEERKPESSPQRPLSNTCASARRGLQQKLRG